MVIQGYENCTWKVKIMAYVNTSKWYWDKTEILDEMFTYEDNVGLLVLKMIGLQDLRWDIHGTGAGDGGDAQKVQHKYGSGAGSWSLVDPPHNVRWDIDGTGAGDGVDPQKVQHK